MKWNEKWSKNYAKKEIESDIWSVTLNIYAIPPPHYEQTNYKKPVFASIDTKCHDIW